MDALATLRKIYDPKLLEQLLRDTAPILSQDLTRHLAGEAVVNAFTKPEAEYKFWSEMTEAGHPPIPWTELLSIILKRSIRIQNPGFIGHQVTAAAPMAAIGGLISDYLNNGMGVYEMGTAAVALERIIIEWVTETIGFGKHRGGFLTSGGSLANLTALLSARNEWRRRTKSDESILIPGVIISAQAHYSVERAVRILDLEIIRASVTPALTIDVAVVEECINVAKKRGVIPVALVASAGTTATGSFDDLSGLSKFCQIHQIWMHVDGAHGGSAIFSDKYKPLVEGMSGAHSVSIDFHKMMMVPALCTALVYRDPQDSYQTYIHQASYLFENEQEEWFNIAKRSFECTKFMMSLKVFLMKYYYGVEGFQAYIDNQFDLARSFSVLVSHQDDFQLYQTPSCNIVCFRYIGHHVKTISELNNLNSQIRQRILEDGDFYIVQTTLDGDLWLRCTFMNPFTNQEIQHRLIIKIRQIGATLS